ncbi:chromosome partitioning protein ParA [Bacillus sp. LL01]|nr:chromosome partitioning protein ParA [Bacillus sp. LL01]
MVVLFGSGCNNMDVFSAEQCEQNWAICIINDSQVVNLSGSKVKVAILDSGINSELEILQNKIKETYNTIEKSSVTNDEYGHGTMVASIIAANPNSHTIIGVNPNVEIYDVQVLNHRGGGRIEDLVEGIKWSINKNVDIINMSFGYPKDDPRLKEVIELALSKNIIIVASAGNTLGLSTEYPAKYKGVYSISAVEQNLNNYKLAAKGKIDFVAPGVNIPVINHEGEKLFESGTSLSTAYATGIISVVKSSTKTNKEIKIVSKNIGDKEKFGKGLLKIK